MVAHYNKGIIFGKIISAQEDKMQDKRYPDDPDKKVVCCNLQVSCPGDFGTVRVFAKIMQEKLAQEFLQEENQGKFLRLDGFFAQYKDHGGSIKSNYNILSWDPCSQKNRSDLRAVFILVGRIEDVNRNEDGEQVITLITEREANGRKYTSTFYLASTNSDEEFRIGEVYRCKGELRPVEDRFGEVTSIRPLILEWNLVEDKVSPVGIASSNEGDIPF